MRRLIKGAAAAVAAGVALSAFGLTGGSAATRAATAAGLAAHPLAGSGARLWVKRYNGPGSGDDAASAVAASPDGRTLYVTGYSSGAGSGEDYATVAYNAATGARRWAARYNGPGNAEDSASALAVSRDGKRVYVTGTSSGEYATVAYNAATGARLWAVRHHGPANGGSGSSAVAVAVSPDNRRVFVTGTTQYGDDPACPDTAYDTLAYSAATGARLWGALVCNFSSASALAVSPDGKRVYVTGMSDAEGGMTARYGTVAYNAATGTAIWTRHYGSSGSQSGWGSAIAVSPDGTKVYVTGSITEPAGGNDVGTIAYSAAGRQLWVKRHPVPGMNWVYLDISMAVSPAGTVVVTGGIKSAPRQLTIAYSPAGRQRWAKMHDGTTYSIAAPGNGKVYVTGTSASAGAGSDYATIAYNIFSGAQLWIRHYAGPAHGSNKAAAVAARSGRVFVTGGSPGTTSRLDYATIAYKS